MPEQWGMAHSFGGFTFLLFFVGPLIVMDEYCVVKGVALVLLFYLVYVVASCPCKPKLFCCHLDKIYFILAVFVLMLVYYNGLTIWPC